jgi:hypothetical protein
LRGITFGVIRTDDFHHQIRAQPVAILAARVMGIAYQQDIRLTEFTRADLYP